MRLTMHVADVADGAQVDRFRDEVSDRHATDKIHLLFNNAGIGGGGSMIANSRIEWERTFNICWGGVYLCTRSFLPMLAPRKLHVIFDHAAVFWSVDGVGGMDHLTRLIDPAQFR
jgi:NAD(P)-dependent dehydrogenase (short-subunit alcohol dehydrogenase family)